MGKSGRKRESGGTANAPLPSASADTSPPSAAPAAEPASTSGTGAPVAAGVSQRGFVRKTPVDATLAAAQAEAAAAAAQPKKKKKKKSKKAASAENDDDATAGKKREDGAGKRSAGGDAQSAPPAKKPKARAAALERALARVDAAASTSSVTSKPAKKRPALGAARAATATAAAAAASSAVGATETKTDTAGTPTTAGTASPKSRGLLWCLLCEKSFTKAVQLRKHREEDIYHKRKARAAKLLGPDCAGDVAGPASGADEGSTLFVGQLPFDCNAEQLRTHLIPAAPSGLRVRLLTDKTSGNSRGMAFVDVSDPLEAPAVLALHQSLLQGRRITVERTLPGRAQNTVRVRSIKQLRTDQDRARETQVKELVERVAKEYATFDKAHVNSYVLEYLCTVPPAIAESALVEFASGDHGPLRKPSAFLSGIIKRHHHGGKLPCFLCGSLEHRKAGCPDREAYRQQGPGPGRQRPPPRDDDDTDNKRHGGTTGEAAAGASAERGGRGQGPGRSEGFSTDRGARGRGGAGSDRGGRGGSFGRGRARGGFSDSGRRD